MLISYGKQYQLDQNADQQLHLGFPQYASEGLAGIGALCKRTGLGMRFRIEAAAIATAIATATANQKQKATIVVGTATVMVMAIAVIY